MRVNIWTDLYGVVRKTPIPESHPYVYGEIIMASVTDQEWKGLLSGDTGINTLKQEKQTKEVGEEKAREERD